MRLLWSQLTFVVVLGVLLAVKGQGQGGDQDAESGLTAAAPCRLSVVNGIVVDLLNAGNITCALLRETEACLESISLEDATVTWIVAVQKATVRRLYIGAGCFPEFDIKFSWQPPPDWIPLNVTSDCQVYAPDQQPAQGPSVDLRVVASSGGRDDVGIAGRALPCSEFESCPLYVFNACNAVPCGGAQRSSVCANFRLSDTIWGRVISFGSLPSRQAFFRANVDGTDVGGGSIVLVVDAPLASSTLAALDPTGLLSIVLNRDTALLTAFLTSNYQTLLLVGFDPAVLADVSFVTVVTLQCDPTVTGVVRLDPVPLPRMEGHSIVHDLTIWHQCACQNTSGTAACTPTPTAERNCDERRDDVLEAGVIVSSILAIAFALLEVRPNSGPRDKLKGHVNVPIPFNWLEHRSDRVIVALLFICISILLFDKVTEISEVSSGFWTSFVRIFYALRLAWTLYPLFLSLNCRVPIFGYFVGVLYVGTACYVYTDNIVCEARDNEDFTVFRWVPTLVCIFMTLVFFTVRVCQEIARLVRLRRAGEHETSCFGDGWARDLGQRHLASVACYEQKVKSLLANKGKSPFAKEMPKSGSLAVRLYRVLAQKQPDSFRYSPRLTSSISLAVVWLIAITLAYAVVCARLDAELTELINDDTDCAGSSFVEVRWTTDDGDGISGFSCSDAHTIRKSFIACYSLGIGFAFLINLWTLSQMAL